MNTTRSIPTLLSRYNTTLLRSSYWQAVGKLAGAAGLAQVLSFATSLFSSRIYTPEMMGMLGVVGALVGIIAPVSSLRYEMAIPLAGTSNGARRLLKVCVVMVLFTAFGSCVYALLCALQPRLAPAENLGPLIWFLPLLLLLAGLINCVTYWCNRIAAFGLLSRFRVLLSVVNGLVVVPVGWLLGGSGLWLFIGNAVSSAAAVFYMAKKSGLTERPSASDPAAAGYRKLLRQYRQFPTFNAPMALLDQMATMAPALLLAIYYSTAVTGQYNMCMAVMRVPSALVGAAIAQVFYSQAAGLSNNPTGLRNLVKNTTLVLLAMAIPMVLVMGFFGSDLFSLVFSPRWREAGEFAKILVWPSALTLLLSSTSMLPSLLNLQHKQFLIGSGGAIVRIGLLWYGCTTTSTTGALWWCSAAECVSLFAYGAWIAWELRKSRKPAPISEVP